MNFYDQEFDRTPDATPSQPVPTPSELKLHESVNVDMFSQSLVLKDLMAALCLVQGSLKPAVMDMKNPHYNSRYASLTSCQETYQALLKEHGLVLTQQTFSFGEGYYFRSLLFHAPSGQWLSSIFKLKLDKQNMQGLGSAITYARRYSGNPLLGVVDTEDDDGTDALPKSMPAKDQSVKPKSQGVTAQPVPTRRDSPPASTGMVTVPQLSRLFTILSETGWTEEQLKLFIGEAWGMSSTKELTQERYNKLVGLIQTMPYNKAIMTIVK